MNKKRLVPLLFFFGIALLLLVFLFFMFFPLNFSPSFDLNDTPMGNMMGGRNGMNRETNTVELREPEQPSTKLHLPTLLKSDYETDTEVSYTVVADEGQTSFREGPLTETYGYNGSYLGPVLQMRRGQQVHINLQNKLEEETTFHWHGLKIASDVDGGPHHAIEAEGSAEVDFTVDQEAATLWFHSHAHQKSAEQVYNGLSGLIFVEDEHSDSLDLPKEYGVNDFPIILQERFFDEDNQFNYDTVYNFDGTTGDTPLVNGTIRPYIEVGQEWVRLRVVNGSNARNYQLRLSDESFFYQIGTDGGFLETPVERKEFLLSPGERAEIVVDMSKYKVGEEVSLVDISTTEILALQITGDKSGSLKPLPEKLNDVPPVEADSLPDRQIEMSGMGHMVTLNGRKFDLERIDFTVEQGKKEVWDIAVPNTSMMMGDMPHPFHIHGVQFRILSRNGSPPEAYESGWKDTFLVSPGEVVKIEIEFSQPGIFMLHCHILEHEDNGMMGQILVK